MTLTIGIPFFGDRAMLRQCVTSLRAQTFRDLRILVIGDGQKPGLRTTDSRVQVYTLPTNKGAYFARAVALAATETPWHGVVDADDWVEPEWAETLLAASADAVQHGCRFVEELGQPAYVKPWRSARRRPTPHLVHYTSHTGIYGTERLRAAGGYSPAFRIGYDSFLSAILRLLGPVEIVDRPLYHRRIHPDSLCQAASTRICVGPERLRVRAMLDSAYANAFRLRDHPHLVRRVVDRLTPPALWDEVHEHAEKVRRG